MEKEIRPKSKDCGFCVECCLDISELIVSPLEIDYINEEMIKINPDFKPLNKGEYNKKSICPYCDIKNRRCTIYQVRHRFCRIFGPFMESNKSLYSACVFREEHTIYDRWSSDKIPCHREFCALTKDYLDILSEKEKEDYLKSLSKKPSEEEKMKNSIQEYLEAIEKYPDYAPLYYHLAKRYSFLGIKKEAFENLIKSLTIDPTQFQSYYLLAFRLNELGLINEGIICLKRALRGAPWHGKAKFSLALFYIQAGRYKEAIESFNELLNTEPDALEKYDDMKKYMELAAEMYKETSN